MKLLGLLVVMLLLPLSVRAQNETMPDLSTLTVTGSGHLASTPDTAFVTLAVETAGKSLADAQRQNSRVMQKVVERLQALQIPKERIQTSSFTVSPHYRPLSKRPTAPVRRAGNYRLQRQQQRNRRTPPPGAGGGRHRRILDCGGKPVPRPALGAPRRATGQTHGAETGCGHGAGEGGGVERRVEGQTAPLDQRARRQSGRTPAVAHGPLDDGNGGVRRRADLCR